MGGRLADVTVAYETYGRLNRRGDNAVLICHALSGDSHVARHDAEDDPGWWDIAVGPGKPIDTDKLLRHLPEHPRRLPRHDRPEQRQPGDRQAVRRGLPDDHHRRHRGGPAAAGRAPGHRKLRAVVGGSMGGHQVLTWATRFPDQVEAARGAGHLGAADRQALAFDVVGRNAILRDPQLPRRPVLRQGRARRSAWPSRACSATSPTSRRRR